MSWPGTRSPGPPPPSEPPGWSSASRGPGNRDDFEHGDDDDYYHNGVDISKNLNDDLANFRDPECSSILPAQFQRYPVTMISIGRLSIISILIVTGRYILLSYAGL